MSSEKVLQKTLHPNQQPPTQSSSRRKKIQAKSDIRSPTDNLVSPCTRKLLKKPDKTVKPLPQVPKFSVEDKENAAVFSRK